jgi:hypothetical protein
MLAACKISESQQYVLIILVSLMCGLDTINVLTTNNGVISSLPGNFSDMDYEIRAPVGKKIELTFVFFNFIPCKLHDQACVNNHHLIISNQQGAIDTEFYIQMMKNKTDWIFCDSNRPFKKYISLSNELTLSTRLNNPDLRNFQNPMPDYLIHYRFLDTEFTENGQIRVVQDIEKLSPINGYLHTIKVPASHHLRITGKSNKCQMPTYTVLSKRSVDRLFNRVNKILTLNRTQFIENDCTYSFDISEPQVVEKSTWYVDWFLKFNTAFDAYDFELTWTFIRNQLKDYRKTGTIQLPKQYGFNLTEELEFDFLSTNSANKYALRLVTVNNNTDSRTDQHSYIRSKVFGLQELRIPLLSHVSNRSEHNLQKFNGTLFIKRNVGWSMTIQHEMSVNECDCDFDESFCGYEFQVSNEIRHFPKYSAFNSYTEISDNKDFYLNVRNLFNNTIYSPLISLQKTQNIDKIQGSINNKLIFLSFSYMRQTPTAKLSLLIDATRSDVRDTLQARTNVQKTVMLPGDGAPVKLLDVNKHCDSNEGPLNEWRRVENIPVFSCFDFRLGFEFGINETMGLDDVEVNRGNDALEKCDEIKSCSNNGECYKFKNEEVCCCFPGFTGDNCSVQENACNSITCQNNSTCLTTPGFNYKCQCQPGYTGPHCQTEINECLLNPCGANGICHDKIGSYSCACQPGFSGINCQDTSKFCKSTCSPEGTLKCFEAGQTSVKCQCKHGYTGEFCDVNVNECVSNPCLNEAECIDKIDSFECVCPEGKTGHLCQLDIDYCNQHGHMCQMNSTCLEANITSVTKCQCPYGFTGTFCTEAVLQVNCDPNPCQNSGVCIEQDIGYSCMCPKGKVGNNCEVSPLNPCFGNKCANGHCMAIDGDYVCKCFDNYSGDFCEKQECHAGNLEQFCVGNNTLEVVRDNSFHDTLVCTCSCKSGYMGERCEIRLDMCDQVDIAIGFLQQKGHALHFDKYCANGGICNSNNEFNAIECQCAPGFTGDRCEETLNNACESNPCKYGTCTNLVDDMDAYVCKCSNGWTGANCDELLTCSIDSECVSNNTLSVKYSFADNRCICVCKHGFEGNDCSVDHDDCDQLKPEFVCQNGGKCIDKVGTYDCECPSGFGGMFCEQKLKGCAMNPCKFGKCEEDNFSIFKCNCDTGYSGDLCATPIDLCSSNPCQHNARCHNLIPTINSTQHDFFCECPPDFGDASKTCLHRTVDPCTVSPCLNKAQCSSTSQFIKLHDKKTLIYTDFKCKCPQGFTGDLCQEKITSCATDPCKNRGRCTPSRTDDSIFTCSCFPAFTGKLCEHLLDQCASFPCSNGAKCMSTPKGPKCQCPINFKGDNCEVKIKACDTMTCLNGGQCVQDERNNVPFCECSDKRFTGTQCEIDLNLFTNSSRVRSGKIVEADDLVNCGVLGNNVTVIDYVFFSLVIACILVAIIGIIYVYVQIKIKRVKRYLRKVNFDNEITTEIHQVTNPHRMK